MSDHGTTPTPHHTPDQAAPANAGEREGGMTTSEGATQSPYVLIPYEWTDEMLKALSTTFWETGPWQEYDWRARWQKAVTAALSVRPKDNLVPSQPLPSPAPGGADIVERLKKLDAASVVGRPIWTARACAEAASLITDLRTQLGNAERDLATWRDGMLTEYARATTEQRLKTCVEALRDARSELQSSLDCLRMVINATSSDRLYKEANVAAKDCVAAIERIDKALSPMTELCSEPLESPDYSRPGGPKTEAERERMIREAAMEANKTRKADLQRVGVTTENILAPVAAAYEACAKIAEAEAERISGDYRAGAGALCVATAIRKAAQGLEHPIPSPAPSPAPGGEDIVERLKACVSVSGRAAANGAFYLRAASFIADLRTQVETLNAGIQAARQTADDEFKRYLRANERLTNAERDAAALQQWWDLNPSLFQHRIADAEAHATAAEQRLAKCVAALRVVRDYAVIHPAVEFLQKIARAALAAAQSAPDTREKESGGTEQTSPSQDKGEKA